MKLSIYCDGGSRGNPGPAAIAFVVFKNGTEVKRFSKTIGRATNNGAEYQAVLAALAWLKKSTFAKKDLSLVNFYLDSQLVANQLLGVYKVKSWGLKELVVAVKKKEKEVGVRIFYHFISREKNKIADFLVNRAFGQRT